MKIKLQKIVGNLLDKLRKLYMDGTVIYKRVETSSRPQVIENSRQYLLLPTDVLQKTFVGSP